MPTPKQQVPLTPAVLPVFNSEGKEIDTIKLDAGVFDGEINRECLYQVIEAYRANQRRGLAATKTRGEVSGGGKKPWKQKGTGRARVGSTRSPLWRHGGVVFGPHPRDFSYELPGKIKAAALKTALNAKLKENNLMVLDSLELAAPKTRMAVKVFQNLKLVSAKDRKSRKILFLSDKLEKNQKMALKNISFLTVDLAGAVHAYEAINSKKILITKAGLSKLTERLKK